MAKCPARVCIRMMMMAWISIHEQRRATRAHKCRMRVSQRAHAWLCKYAGRWRSSPDRRRRPGRIRWRTAKGCLVARLARLLFLVPCAIRVRTRLRDPRPAQGIHTPPARHPPRGRPVDCAAARTAGCRTPVCAARRPGCLTCVLSRSKREPGPAAPGAAPPEPPTNIARRNLGRGCFEPPHARAHQSGAHHQI